LYFVVWLGIKIGRYKKLFGVKMKKEELEKKIRKQETVMYNMQIRIDDLEDKLNSLQWALEEIKECDVPRLSEI